MDYLIYPEISREYNVVVQSFFFWFKFINFTLFRCQTHRLYFSTMILKALQLMGS